MAWLAEAIVAGGRKRESVFGGSASRECYAVRAREGPSLRGACSRPSRRVPSTNNQLPQCCNLASLTPVPGKDLFMPRQLGTYATFDTSEGTIVCRLFEQEAPITVKNFIELAEGSREWTHPHTRVKSQTPLYNGTIFHRVIPDFMVQGGDPAGTGMGGPGYQFQDETRSSPHKFDQPGMLAMANSGPNTNGSQFFITVVPTPWLTGKHTIFGEVVEGQDVVDKITKVPRNRQDKPQKDVVLNSVRIERS